MEPEPDSPQPSYRTRNTILAGVALVAVIAAIVRLGQTAHEVPPEQVPVMKSSLPAQATLPTTAAAGGAIDVAVTYDGARPPLPDTAKVFVFIRPVGDRMPLAVQTYTPKDLPVVVEFSNPTGASAATEIEAVARLSRAGSVTLQSGDSEVVSAPVHFGADAVHVTLALGASTTGTASSPISAPPQGSRIAVHVALGAGVDLPSGTTVFLIIRESGNPMPLAVKRLTVADLPTDLVLTDADAMVPGRVLGASTTVEIIARASRSGDVKAGPGDFEARSGPLATAAIHAETPIQLVIASPV